MPQQLPGGTYLTVTEAVRHMGCTDGWVRMLIRTGKLEAIRFGQRAWLIPQKAADEAKKALSSRSVGKRDAKKPVAKRRKQA